MGSKNTQGKQLAANKPGRGKEKPKNAKKQNPEGKKKSKKPSEKLKPLPTLQKIASKWEQTQNSQKPPKKHHWVPTPLKEMLKHLALEKKHT